MNDQSLVEFEKWWRENGVHKGEGYAVFKEYGSCLEAWQAACKYKEAEINEYREAASSEAVLVNELQAENAKLFEEAKRELAYKDKKIAYLEAECERVYHPIREFWNQEKDEEMKRLRNDLDEAVYLLGAFLPLAEGNSRLTNFMKRMNNE